MLRTIDFVFYYCKLRKMFSILLQQTEQTLKLLLKFLMKLFMQIRL